MRTVLEMDHLVTAEEFARLPDNGHRYELVEGRIIEMPPPDIRHGVLADRMGAILVGFVERYGLGIVMTESGFKLAANPDTVRGPDLSFVRGERIPASGIPEGYWPGAPDLVVEIRSPRNRYTEIRRKVDNYLGLGTSLVWVVDPKKRHVVQHVCGEAARTLAAGDRLDGGEVLPGFQCEVAALFAGLG
jgi:Uma2 family endonuclease